MSNKTHALSLLMLGLLWPVTANAQDGRGEDEDAPVEQAAEPEEPGLELPEPSQGHYLSLGIAGASSLAHDQDRGWRDPSFGYAMALRLGQSVTSWFDLGIAIEYGTTMGDQDHSIEYGGARVQAQLYPLQTWFVRGGFGLLLANGTDPDDNEYDRGVFGAAFELGVGHNIFLSDAGGSGGWVLTPVLSAQLGPDPEFTTFVTHLGVEISWWSGLSRDELDLPFDEAYDPSID